MYCTGCGKEMLNDDRFCPSCGAAAAIAPPHAGGTYRGRLVRVNEGKKLAGVCAGIARYNDWDVTLVRVAFLAGIVVHGLGPVAYVIAWAAMPREDYVNYPAAR